MFLFPTFSPKEKNGYCSVQTTVDELFSTFFGVCVFLKNEQIPPFYFPKAQRTGLRVRLSALKKRRMSSTMRWNWGNVM